MPTDPSDKSDPSGTPPAESTDSGKSVTDRVNEFVSATSQKGASSKDVDERLAAAEAELKSYREAEASRAYRQEMDDYMIPTVLGDLDVHPKLVESWLNEQGDRDPRLTEIWNNRATDRAKFEEAIEGLKSKFEAYADKEGLKGTAKPKDSRNPQAKLQSAVRSARQSTSELGNFNGVDVAGLSDTDFAFHKAEVFRLASSGQLN